MTTTDTETASTLAPDMADREKDLHNPGDGEEDLRRLGMTPLSTRSSTREDLGRTRSQNGYGVEDERDGDDAAAEAGAQPEKDPFEVGWDGGDNDPLCPRSFSKARKWMIVLICAVGSFTVTCASSIYTSTYTQMEAEFHNAREISDLGLSTFVLGIAFGPMLLSPLSEFYGRRPVYLVSWTMYVIWLVPSAVARNVATMIVARFFDGLAGSAFLTVSGGTTGDLFAKHELQLPMAVFSIAPFIGPSIGPFLGGFINYFTHWRWTYYVLLIWAGVMWVAIVLLVPETYHTETASTLAPDMADREKDLHNPGDGEEDLRRLGMTPLSTRSSTREDLGRTRSQNGYGVEDERDGDDAAAEAGAQPEKDPFEVGWDGGDNDPLCPRSFSKARKWMIVLICAVGSFTVTCASSIYTSTYTQMEAEFHNAREISDLGLSTFVLGIAFGPMLLSPLSEFYGRRPVYLVSWTMYVIWLVPSAVARNVATMIVARFFDGLAGSAFLTVSGGTTGDLFAKHELQLPMAVFSIAPFIGPSIGPFLGGFINYFTHWRWTYYVLLIWAGVMWVAIVLLVPETYHPILLRNKARKLRKDTGDDRWMAPSEKSTKTVSRAILVSLQRPFQLLIFEPMCLLLCLFCAILLGILYLFFGAFPLVFSTNHGFKLWQIGLTFLGIGVGMVVAMLTDPVWHRIRLRLMARLERETGVPGASEPEFRLPSAIAGSVLVPAGLFMFAWTTYSSVPWIVPIVGSGLFGMGNLLVFSGIFTFLVDAYPMYAASALAANAFVRCSFAAVFPLFGTQMYNTLGFQWASSLLAFLTLAMVPFPYLFFKYGKKIRTRSRYAKS